MKSIVPTQSGENLAAFLEDATIGDLLERAERLYGNRIALEFPSIGRTMSFSELKVEVSRVAGILRLGGIQREDRVAIALTNRPEFVVSMLAAAQIGGIAVLVNPKVGVSDLGHVLSATSPALLIGELQLDAVLKKLEDQSHHLRAWLIPSDVERTEELWRDLATFLGEGAADDIPDPRLFPESPLSIYFTSGSTGRPKGCLMSHRYWTRVLQHMLESPTSISSSDKLLSPLPFYYQDAFWHLLAALGLGIPFVVLPRFSLKNYWRDVVTHRATFLFWLGAIPTILLNAAPNELEESHHVTRVLYPGIPPQLQRPIEDRFRVKCYELFGMNETAAVTVMEWSEHDSLVGSGCIGRVLPGREVRVFDEHQRQVARGDVGELAVRGEGMMEGYFHDPEGTEAAFRGGWFYTGDLVTQDEEGRLYYVRRKNDRVRRSGENISAVEVEQVLMSHPAIVLAAVVPVTDALRGEEVKVYIRARTDADSDEIDPGQLAAFCETLLSPHKIPRYWEFRAELPLLSSEKVDKQSLRSSKDILANTYDRSEGRWLE